MARQDLKDDAEGAFTDGRRWLPPENVEPGDTLRPNVMRHYEKASYLLESARDCQFCELLRVAIILDCKCPQIQATPLLSDPILDIISPILDNSASRVLACCFGCLLLPRAALHCSDLRFSRTARCKVHSHSSPSSRSFL